MAPPSRVPTGSGPAQLRPRHPEPASPPSRPPTSRRGPRRTQQTRPAAGPRRYHPAAPTAWPPTCTRSIDGITADLASPPAWRQEHRRSTPPRSKPGRCSAPPAPPPAPSRPPAPGPTKPPKQALMDRGSAQRLHRRARRGGSPLRRSAPGCATGLRNPRALPGFSHRARSPASSSQLRAAAGPRIPHQQAPGPATAAWWPAARSQAAGRNWCPTTSAARSRPPTRPPGPAPRGGRRPPAGTGTPRPLEPPPARAAEFDGRGPRCIAARADYTHDGRHIRGPPRRRHAPLGRHHRSGA